LPQRFSASWSGDSDRFRFFCSSGENNVRRGNFARCGTSFGAGATVKLVEGFVSRGLVKRARFEEALDDSWWEATATTCRFADRGVFRFPGVFFFAEVRFLGDLAFEAFARSFLGGNGGKLVGIQWTRRISNSLINEKMSTGRRLTSKP
jgi:hypothetical protein